MATARFVHAGLVLVLALSAAAAVPARGGECPDEDLLPNNAAAQYPTGRYDGLSEEDRMILTRVKSFMAKNGLVLAQPPTSAPASARPSIPTFDDLIAAWVAQQQQQQPQRKPQQQQAQAQPGSRLFIPAPLAARPPMQNAPRPATPPPKQVLAEIPVQAVTAKSPRSNATSPKAAGARTRTSPQSQRATPRMGVPSPSPSSPRPAFVQVQQKPTPDKRTRVGAAVQSAPKPKSNGTRINAGVPVAAPVTTPVPSMRETIRSGTNKAGLRPSSPTPAKKSSAASSAVPTRPSSPPPTANVTSPAPSQRERNSPPPSQRERTFTSEPAPSPTSDSGSNMTSEPTTAPLSPNSEEAANTTAADDATPAPVSDDVTPAPTPEPSNSTAENVTAEEEPSPSPAPDAPSANVTETLPAANDAATPTPDANATDVESGPVGVNVTDCNVGNVTDNNVTGPDDADTTPSSNSTTKRSSLKSVAGPEPVAKAPSEMLAEEVAALETNRTYVDRDALAQNAPSSSTSNDPADDTDDAGERDSAAVAPEFDDDDDEFDDDDDASNRW